MPTWTRDGLHRLVQGLRALKPANVPVDRERVLIATLTNLEAGAFRNLPAYDQVHLLGVHARLIAEGASDPDLLAAGLLHDIGKADQNGVVRLPDRVARVLLKRLAPGTLRRLSASPSPGAFYGLYLCVHHPWLGAERAAALGCSARTVWLIANHESDNIPSDQDLAMLQAADRG